MAPDYREAPEEWGRAPPRVVYVDRPGPSVEKLTMPIVLVVSVVGFAAWATWWGTTAVKDIQSSVKDLGQALTNYIVRADLRMQGLDERLDQRTQERWTVNDQELWCLRTERKNPNWSCGPTRATRADDHPPIWDGARDVVEGWQPRTKKP